MNNTAKPEQPALPHRLVLDERRHAEITGVREVVRFDDTLVVLRTVKGMLLLRGTGLKLLTLTPDGGRVVVEGALDSTAYEAEQIRGGFFRRLFG